MGADDRSGPEIAKALDAIVEKKANLSVAALIVLGVLAGVYIGFGAVAATKIKALGGASPALTSFLAASAFCVGLILVIIPGSELFTGNILMTVGLVERNVPAGKVLRLQYRFVFHEGNAQQAKVEQLYQAYATP